MVAESLLHISAEQKKAIFIDKIALCLFGYLFYTGDMVLITEGEEKLQSLLKIVGRWCKKSGLIVNKKGR